MEAGAIKKQQEPERKVFVTISNGKRKDKLETWRYWEIVGALQWMGADRKTAYDAAKWVMRSKPGDSMDNVRPVVRGKWVQVMGKYDWMVKCSRCNGVPLETSNFCPNCVAGMREVKDEP